jgi:membrane-bound serine protease (ClpP class)
MTRRLRALLAATAAAALLAVTTTDNRADTLTKKDGKTFEGRVVAETADSVTFESNSGGITLRQRISRANIRSIRKQVVEGPGYCVIPIKGMIGNEVTAAAFQAALDEARRAGAEYVILQIDSPGGDVGEKSKILRVLADNRDLKFVAHVRRAISAAAIIAIGCPHIVMAPGASIGATVVFRVGPNGTPQNIEEKWESAIRAEERGVAAMGGHSDLWIRGMSEMDLELHVVTGDDGRPRVCEGPAPEGATVLKKKGQILTVTAAEALAAGLSEATVRDVSEIRELLGVAKWHDAGDAAASLMASRTRVQSQETAARNDRVRQLKGDLAEIDAKLQRAADEAKAAERAILELRNQYQAEVGAMDADYRRDFEAAKARGGAAPLLVQEAARARAIDCRRKYDALINEKLAAQQAALARGRDLIAQRGRLITAALPND